jgi:hypothetical protein
MNTVVHKILLKGEGHFGNKLPPRHLGLLLAEVPLAVRESISMALQNQSRRRGRQPHWLDEAADIRFVGHEGNGDATLFFEAPTLGSAAQELYQQQALPGFSTRPSPDDTGFDLLGDVLADVQQRNADSEHFDPLLLNRLAKFHKVFHRSPFGEVQFVSRRYGVQSPAVLAPETVVSAKSLLHRTPSPQRVRIAGQLDGLEASTQRFWILLDTGEKVVGLFADDQMDIMQTLWRQRVLVRGVAVYRASGRLLRIDADTVTSGDGEAAIFSQMPAPSHAKLDVARFRKLQGSRSGMAAIMGQWPGDESDDEVEVALERLS